MLLGNYTQMNANPGRNIGGFTNPYDWLKLSNVMKFYGGDSEVADVTDKSSFNNGYTHPYSWAMSPRAGGLAMNATGSSLFSTNLIPQYLAIANFTGSGNMASSIIGYGNLVCGLTGSSSWSADITAKGNILISFTGLGDLTATVRGDGYVTLNMTGSGTLSGGLSLFLNMVAAMTGSGTLSADAALVVGMICDMSGGGTLSASITGQKGMTVSLTGTGNLAADINAFAEMVINLVGSGTLNAGTGAIANMSIDMVVTGTGLTTSNVGDAVWAALQTNINNAGTAGAALLAAGSAGDPWSTTLPSSYTGTQAGAILDRIQTLVDELHRLQGLDASNPVTITPTSRTATGIDIAIGGNGETLTTLERQ